MSNVQDEFAGRLSATANRLRLIQVDFADQGDDVRKQYLAEEMSRAIEAIIPERRREFLEALADRFPTWDGMVELPASKAQASVQSESDKKELQDPGFLIARLCDLAPKLSGDQLQGIADRLRAASIIPPASGAWSAQSEAPVRNKLQFNARQTLDPDRSMELLDLLLDMALNLDQLVWGTWRNIGPESWIKRPAPLQRMIRAFMTGDANVPKPNLEKDIKTLRALTAAIVSAAGEIGRSFSTDHSDRFAPHQIEDSARAEGIGTLPIFNNVAVKCWQKYLQLASTMEAASVEKEIKTKIAELVEKLVGGAQGSGVSRR